MIIVFDEPQVSSSNGNYILTDEELAELWNNFEEVEDDSRNT